MIKQNQHSPNKQKEKEKEKKITRKKKPVWKVFHSNKSTQYFQ